MINPGGIRTSAAAKPVDDAIIAYIASYQRAKRVSPSVRDLAAYIGAGVAPAHGHLHRLERLGRLKVRGVRNIEIVDANPLARFSSQELLAELERRDRDPAWNGIAACGLCELRAEDPAVKACTHTDCQLRVREVA